MKKMLLLGMTLITFLMLSACFDSSTEPAEIEKSKREQIADAKAAVADAQDEYEYQIEEDPGCESDDCLNALDLLENAEKDLNKLDPQDNKEDSSEEQKADESSEEIKTESSSEAKTEESSEEEQSVANEDSSEPKQSVAADESSEEKQSSVTKESSEESTPSSSEEMSSEENVDPGTGPAGSPVAKYGFLKTEGNKIVSTNTGEPVQLIGMSLFWSQWGPVSGGTFYNEDVVDWLVLDWKIDLIRAALGVNEEGIDEDGLPAPDGYIQHEEMEMKKMTAVIDAAIKNGIYVLVDWHDHRADEHTSEEIAFFEEIATKYGEFPNIIYETFNEPQMPCDAGGCAGGHQNPNFDENRIMTHQNEVIQAIRAIDTKNHIAIGSKLWSSTPEDVVNAVENGVITDPSNNISATMHLYALTHVGSHIPKAEAAYSRNFPVFATEWGTSDPVEQTTVGVTETNQWLQWMKDNKISWANWSLGDKDEANSALVPDASTTGDWGENELSESGKLIRAYIREQHGENGNDFPN